MSTNPLVAGRVDEPVPAWSGAWIAEDIELIGHGVRSGSWVDGSLGALGAALDGLAVVSDPIGTLLQYGVSWLIEHVRPLSQALDWLAGDPAAIAAQAQTWRRVAGSLLAESDVMAQAVRLDLTEWSGAAAQAYRRWVNARTRSLQVLASAANTTAAIVEGAGVLVGTVREMVRDAVATLVSRLMVYAAELVGTAGLATPLVVEQVSALCASWAARIARWLRALITSLGRLMRESEHLGELVRALNKRHPTDSPNGGKPSSHHPDAQHADALPTHENDLELPDFSKADVDPRKITAYIMNPDHPRGRDKYRVINSRTGLDTHDAILIEEQIRKGVRNGTPVVGDADEFGKRWAIDLPLSGPGGSITVRTAWIVDTGSSTPRLVTISFPKRGARA
jgi:uncharacterized protein DUF6883